MYQPQESDELQLRHYLDVVWRRKRIVLLAVATVVAAAVGYTLVQTPSYRSTAEVLLENRVSEDIFDPNPDAGRVQAADRNRVDTEIEVMESRSVQEAVARQIGQQPRVSIKQRGSTNVVAITASSRRPKDAARFAQIYAETFIRIRREQLIAELLTSSTKVQSELDNVRRQLDELQAPLVALDNRIVSSSSIIERQVLQAQRDKLAREQETQRKSLESREAAYATQLDGLRLASSITQSGGVQLVSNSRLPSDPSSPKPERNVAIALALGLALGVALAFVREQYDDAIRTKDDLERVTRGLPLLGIIPSVPGWREPDKPILVSVAAPRSATAEAYRTLRTSLQFGLSPQASLVQVTSPDAGDGKSTTVSNLAVSLAHVGRRVIMVDCDLRRPRLHEFVGLENKVGLTSVLLHDVPLNSAIRWVPGERGLALLSAGPLPENPAELLAHRRTAEVLEMLRSSADIVVIDGPPVLPVTDALILARAVDEVIMVVTAGSTTRHDTAHALEQLDQIGAKVVGTVLNKATGEGGYGYRYGYQYKEQAEAIGGQAANGAKRFRGLRLRKGASRDNGRREIGPRPAAPPTVESKF